MDVSRSRHGTKYVAEFTRRHDGAEHRRLPGILCRITLRPEDRVLDVGCGTGLLLPHLVGRVRDYVGVDFSPDFVRAALERRQRFGLAGHFVCGSVRAVRGPFTLAFALDVSEHVADREWRATLQDIRGQLAPGGRLVLHTPNADFLLERLKSWGVLRQFPEHIAVRSLAENVRQVEAAGFRILRAQAIPHYNVLRALHPLGRVPGVGPWFQARVLIEAERTP